MRAVHQPQPVGAAGRSPARVAGLPRRWLWLTVSAAGIAAAGSVIGLAAPRAVYGQETTALADAATAQDLVNLAFVAPLLIILGIRAAHGSLPAYQCWLGLLAFTAYNYAIYTFAVHFGPLFLAWVAVLGLSVFALIGGVTALDTTAVKGRYGGSPLPWAGWVLIVVAAMFTVLWLREIIPDLLAGGPSRSAAAWRTPTNPVHVLDLAFFLPATAAGGALLLKRHWIGYATAPGLLTFLALTCLPIVVTPMVANTRGHTAGWAVLLPVGAVLAATSASLWRMLTVLHRAPVPQASND